MSNEIPTIQASATLFAIVLGGTDSLLNIHLNNGFKFEKINIFDSPFKDKYVNASGQLLGNYCFCQLPPSSENQAHFICLTKNDNVPCSIMAFTLNQLLQLFHALLGGFHSLPDRKGFITDRGKRSVQLVKSGDTMLRKIIRCL